MAGMSRAEWVSGVVRVVSPRILSLLPEPVSRGRSLDQGYASGQGGGFDGQDDHL